MRLFVTFCVLRHVTSSVTQEQKNIQSRLVRIATLVSFRIS
jgi:hypothetical protein